MALFNMTNKTGTADITAFTVSETGYDCTTDPDATEYTLILHHDGLLGLPVIGDRIYTNSIGTLLWTSSDEANERNIKSDSSHLKVDSKGYRVATC